MACFCSLLYFVVITAAVEKQQVKELKIGCCLHKDGLLCTGCFDCLELFCGDSSSAFQDGASERKLPLALCALKSFSRISSALQELVIWY